MARKSVRSGWLSAIPAALAVIAALTGTAAASAPQRTFVSAQGNDLNPCSLVAPCRSFAAAIVQVASAGEIVVLDSAGYGTVAISKSVSINAPQGVYAGVTVTSGTGITVGSAGIVARVRGLSINGQGGSGGILVADGVLYVEDCTVSGMTDFAFRAVGNVTAFISRSRFADNPAKAIEVANGATVTVNDTEVARSDEALTATTNNPGVTTTLRVSNSIVRESRVGVVALSLLDTGSVRVVANGNTIAGGQFGIIADCACAAAGTVTVLAAGNTVSGMMTYGIASFTPGATLVATRNSLVGNSTGLNGNPGVVLSLQDNASEANLTDAQGLTPRTYH